jgi:hypothetical protein
MIDLNHSRNPAARSLAGSFRACRGVASARSRILFLLAFSLVMVTTARADNPPSYLFEIDVSAYSSGGLLALDSSNNIYVAGDDVVKFDHNGNYLMQ